MLNVLQTDGTTASVPADSSSSPAWFTDTCLQVEYLHVTEKRRQDMVQLYSMPDGMRHFFNEFQVSCLYSGRTQ